MTKSLIVISEGDQGKGITTVGSIGFVSAATGLAIWVAQEVRVQTVWRSAGVFSKLFVRITANSTNGTVTVRTRKNSANGTLTFGIGATLTGTFEDTTHTDTVAAGNDLCIQYVATGTTGTLTFSLISLVFNATTNTVSKLVAEGYTISTASITHYLPTSGDRSGVTTSEAACQNQIKKAGTVKNLSLFHLGHSRTTPTVFTLRKNGADTTLTVTIAAGSPTATVLEDTTHSVIVQPDDKLAWAITTGAGTETLVFIYVSLEYESTDAYGIISAGSVGTTADLQLNTGVTDYMALGGGLTSYAAELDTKLKTRERLTLSNLLVWVSANTITDNSTLRLRKNGANVKQTITITGSGTGVFEDLTNDDLVADTDDINCQIVTGASGTSLTIKQLAITHVIGGRIIRNLSTETMTISEAAFSRLKKVYKTLSETETIGGTLARINGALKIMATQTTSISDGVIRAITHGAGVIAKTLTETIVISELRARLKAIWRYQP